jgi:hypothetical protein
MPLGLSSSEVSLGGVEGGVEEGGVQYITNFEIQGDVLGTKINCFIRIGWFILRLESLLTLRSHIVNLYFI